MLLMRVDYVNEGTIALCATFGNMRIVAASVEARIQIMCTQVNYNLVSVRN